MVKNGLFGSIVNIEFCVFIGKVNKNKMRSRNRRDEFDYSKWSIVFVIGIVADRYLTSQPYYLSPNLKPVNPTSVCFSCIMKAIASNDQNSPTTNIAINCVKEDCLSMESFCFPKNLSHGDLALPSLPWWERFFKAQDEMKYSVYVHENPWFEYDASDSLVFLQASNT
ncbi:hypothetical protein R6Q57_008328 [Mikania cordata]